MATLPTYGFNVRALPRLAEVNPADFRLGMQDFNQGFQGSLANIEGILRNIVLDEAAKSTKRKGAIEEVIQPSRVKTEKTRAEGEAGRVDIEEATKGTRALEEFGELGDERTKRQAERTAATTRAQAGTKRSEQDIQTMDATKSMIDDLAKAEADARLTGDLTTAEANRQKRVALEAVRDDVARNAQAQSQAERGAAQAGIEQNRNAAFQARIAQLPKKQRIIVDADGNQKVDTYVEEPQANGTVRIISLGETGITPKEDVELKRQALETKIQSDAALAAQRTANAEIIKSGKPVSKEVKGIGGETVGFVSVRVNPQTGEFEVSPMVAPGVATSSAMPSVAPTPSAVPTLSPDQAASAPPGLFKGTNGKTYRKNADGSIVLAE